MATGPSLASLVTVQPEVGRQFAFLLPRNAGQLAGGCLYQYSQLSSFLLQGLEVQPLAVWDPLTRLSLGDLGLAMLPFT